MSRLFLLSDDDTASAVGAFALAIDTAVGTAEIGQVGAGALVLADDGAVGAGAVGLIGTGVVVLASDSVVGAGSPDVTGLGIAVLAGDVVSGAGDIDTTLVGIGIVPLTGDTSIGSGAIDASTVDSVTVMEDAIHAWIVAGSGLPAGQVIWATQGGGGQTPTGMYISMRIIAVDVVSDDWILSKASGAAVVHSVRGTRNPMLEITCFAGPNYGAGRAELVLARVPAAIRLPSIANRLRRADVSVGTVGKIRAVNGTRSGMFDPRAIVEIELHTTIELVEQGQSIETVTASMPGERTLVVTRIS